MNNSIVGEKFFKFIAICGTVPFAKKRKYQLEKNLLLYCRFILFMVSMVQMLSFHLHRSFLDQPVFLYALVFFNSFGYGVCCVLSVLYVHFRAENICSILNKIIDSSKKIRFFNAYSLLTPIVIWSFVILEVWLVLYAMYYLFKDNGNAVKVRSLVGVLSLITNHNVLCCNYTFLVMALNVYLLLKKLNESMVEMIHHSFSNLSRDFGLVNQKVIALRDYNANYCSVLDIMSDLNDCFSEINLMSLMFSSSAVIFSVFFFVMKITPKNSLIVFNVVDIVYFLFFFINKSLICLLVARKITQEFEHAVELLRGLYADNNDPKIQEEIEIISLQLHHRDTIFNACGFFNLDNSLILSMINVVTTYTIILIQFEDNPRMEMTKCIFNESQEY